MHAPENRERGREHAILHPEEADGRLVVDRHEPTPVLRPFVDYFWRVRWRLEDGVEHCQQVLPAPVVHVVAERVEGRAVLRVTGVQHRVFERVLTGTGEAVAAAFRPGGFRPFARVPVSALTDLSVSAEEAMRGEDGDEVAEKILADGLPATERYRLLAAWLEAAAPERDPVGERVARLAEEAEHDRSVRRAEHLAERAGVTLRTLQRQFDEYLGVGPKWVVQRFRLLDVAAAAHRGDEVDWAGLAIDLGYADQSHLIRGFKEVVGHPPAAYVRQGRAPS